MPVSLEEKKKKEKIQQHVDDGGHQALMVQAWRLAALFRGGSSARTAKGTLRISH
jgi:hypothetical protein